MVDCGRAMEEKAFGSWLKTNYVERNAGKQSGTRE